MLHIYNHDPEDKSVYITEDNGLTTPSDKIKDFIRVDINVNPANILTLEENSSAPNKITAKSPNATPTKIDGRDAAEITWDGKENVQKQIVVQNDDNWEYLIEFDAWEGYSTLTDNKENIDKILSSFKLLK